MSRETWRKIAAPIVLIAATAFGVQALVLKFVTLKQTSLTAYQPIVKSVMFHASFAVVGAIAFVILARDGFRLAVCIPLGLAILAFWEVYQFWPLVFP